MSKQVLDGQFTIFKQGESSKARYSYCEKIFCYHHSTSTLKRHLLTAHPSKGKRLESATRSTTSSNKSSNNNNSIDDDVQLGSSHPTKLVQTKLGFRCLSDEKKQLLTKYITYWISKHARPCSIVEDTGFKKLLCTALDNHQYTPPSRQTIARRVDVLFAEKREELVAELKSASKVSLTVDYWSSLANENFIGATSHFVSTDWKLINKPLAVEYSSERHTITNVTLHISAIMDKWNIKDKVIAIGSDNARNMVDAMSADRMPCFAHTLQLCVNHAIEAVNISIILAKHRKIVGHVRHSPANFNELKEVYKVHREPIESLVSYSFSISLNVVFLFVH